jgi:hypothetical protein
MRQTIYDLMYAEIINRPDGWENWDSQQLAEWAVQAKTEWRMDVRLLEERYLLADSREAKD